MRCRLLAGGIEVTGCAASTTSMRAVGTRWPSGHHQPRQRTGPVGHGRRHRNMALPADHMQLSGGRVPADAAARSAPARRRRSPPAASSPISARGASFPVRALSRPRRQMRRRPAEPGLVSAAAGTRNRSSRHSCRSISERAWIADFTAARLVPPGLSASWKWSMAVMLSSIVPGHLP